jgi:putative FmdB family regulatory protein
VFPIALEQDGGIVLEPRVVAPSTVSEASASRFLELRRCDRVGSVPIYVYECGSCGLVAEQLLLKRDAGPEPCKCGSTDLAKQVTSASPRFKGGGWGDNVDIMGGNANMRVVQGE